MILKVLLSSLPFLIPFFASAQIFENSPALAGKTIIFTLHNQYPTDHHNTANIFQKGEINESTFTPLSAAGSKLISVSYDKFGSPTPTILHEEKNGIIRDIEISFDAKKALFSMRKNFDDSYKIYEIELNSRKIRRLTNLAEVSDIDPTYLPSGEIIFASTRAAKYCGCNRHIMCNLYKMSPDGENILQIGNSIEFENTPSVMRDGRILYTRWEYVDRNFSGAQGLWTCNPDGTRHALYWGQETKNAAINAVQIPSSAKVVAILSSCHDIAWGALAIIDRNIGIEGQSSVVKIFPESARMLIDKAGDKFADSMKEVKLKYEDPEPISENLMLVSRQAKEDSRAMNLYLLDIQSGKHLPLVSVSDKAQIGVFDAKVVTQKTPPVSIAEQRSYSPSQKALMYVGNVYEGTHLKGIEMSEIKSLRVVENPPKLYWSGSFWENEGSQAPAMNFDDYDDKIILGTVPVEADGSAYFEVPADKFLYLQALDKDGNMLQTMRSGVVVLPGEISSCSGCHESRYSPPPTMSKLSLALKRPPSKIAPLPESVAGSEFSYMKSVQPILDKHCIKCHDFGGKGSAKIILCADRGLVFNQSYLQLHSKKAVSAIGAGPDAVGQANSWGAKQSKIVKMILKKHGNVEMSPEELSVIGAWIDLNAPYYPTEDCAYPENPTGRSPLTSDEIARLFELAKDNAQKIGYTHSEIVNDGAPFGKWDNKRVGNRILARMYKYEVVSFDRPEKSPILSAINKDSAGYKEALDIIKEGAKRLAKKPRADMEGFKISDDAKAKNKRFEALKRLEEYARKSIESEGVFKDPQHLDENK